ncbi:hypothetical protein IW140_003976 [Coemansia sp. RSA 1813]|nr:hypothetical protein LPJ74_005159 [Coemansia sp. RSA 1843]KAJ2213441.1 hypothetical protein EV179_003860 [Coemansia sp. RSA 487]KAJ2568338.1 hypothetical protein IW140_003976 [Coemansia sp. RSA 1813]
MSSSDTAQGIPQMEHDSRARSESSTINSFISSLRLERTNTKSNGLSILQRRKTLHKQAKDPKTDQEALEKEIRHIERLASLLGRRPTKFDLKRSTPTVNHDLDSTLVGFFDVNDDDERLSEALLSGSHTARDDDNDEEHDGFLKAPELKAKNIRTAPTALIADQQTAADYASGDDPFDKIEEMNIVNSPSGSAEYLPLDTYKSNENVVSSSTDKPQLQILDGLDTLHIDSHNTSGGKVDHYSGKDDELDSPTCKDDILADINRSNTWKRQSMALIQERQALGPALPRIADISDEDEEQEDSYDDDVKADSSSLNNQMHPGGVTAGGQLGLVEATAVGTASGAGLLSTTSAVEEYLDILDYMDEKNQNDDGHISSDLQGNSDSSDAGEISLSDGGEGSSDSDSDANGSKYLARLTPQQPRSALGASRKLGLDGASSDNNQKGRRNFLSINNSNAESDSASGSHSARLNSQARVDVAMPLSAGSGISGVPGRSTLRRGRRVLSKGRSLKNGKGLSMRLAQKTPTQKLPALQTAKSEGAGSFVRGATPIVELPRPNSPDSIQREKIASSTAVQTQLPGLAKMAEDAVAASREMNSSTRAKKQMPHTAFYKPLPPIPDRVLRTLDASSSSNAANSVTKIPPPLPDKARPAVPKAFGGERLGTRAEFEAELERPSSKKLFGDDSKPPVEVVGQQYNVALSMSSPTLPITPGGIGSIHRPGTAQSVASEEKSERASSPLAEWLQRTDIMLPTNNPATIKVPLYPPTGSGKSVTFNSYHYEPPAEDAGDNLHPGSRRAARGRVVRRVSVLPPSQAPSAYQRPVSSSSSIYSSVSQNRNSTTLSIPNSPHGSKRNSTASEPTRTSSTDSSTRHNTRPQQNEGPSSVQPTSPSMESPANNSHTEGIATSDAYAFSSMSAPSGPTVLSAPPGAGEMFDDVNASAPNGMLEPSAPMLPEPTAPELPQQWATSSPQTYAFPMPVHYVTNPAQSGYSVSPAPMSPQAPGTPLPERMHGTPPELPNKPRPQSVPSAPLPPPPQATHSQTAPDISVEDVSGERADAAVPASVSRANVMSALLSPTSGFVMVSLLIDPAFCLLHEYF